MDDEMVEALASYAHDAWSRWMQYLFAASAESVDGHVTIHRVQAEVWKRQMNMPYAELYEAEKFWGRVEAEKIISIMEGIE